MTHGYEADVCRCERDAADATEEQRAAMCVFEASAASLRVDLERERAAMRDSATQTEAEENPDASSAVTEVGKGVGNVAA